MRQTPLPLLRNLPADRLVVRCGLCHELVLVEECCGSPLEAPTCPRRAILEGPLQHLSALVLPPLVAVRNLNA